MFLYVFCGMTSLHAPAYFKVLCSFFRKCNKLMMVKYIVLVVISNIFYFHPYLGKISNLTNIFQMGWFNHQPVVHFARIGFRHVPPHDFPPGCPDGPRFLLRTLLPMDQFDVHTSGALQLNKVMMFGSDY